MVVVATPRIVEFAATLRKKKTVRKDRFTWNPGDIVAK